MTSDPDESTVALEFVGLGVGAALVMLPAVFGQEAGGFVRRVLANPVLAWLGVISYGIYLYHLPIELKLLDSVGLPRQGAFAALASASLVVTVVCAAASYYFFERPILRFKEPRRAARSVRAPVAGPAP